MQNYNSNHINSVPKHHKVYPNFSLRGRVYIVTGGGRGLGLAMAEAMTESGADVHCFDRLLKPDPEFVATQELARRAHVGSLHYHHVDVRDSEQLKDIVRKVASTKNRLDGLVAAAGVQQVKPALDYTAAEVTQMMDINYTGVFMTARAVAEQMIDHGCHGSMVLVASMSGMIANKGLICPVYNSSKAAVMQLSRNLAMEWGPKGIRVNSLCPGHVFTAMVEKSLEEDPGLQKKWEDENMLHRLGRPEEFTGAVVFMLSDASSFMTGSALVVDGGHTAWHNDCIAPNSENLIYAKLPPELVIHLITPKEYTPFPRPFDVLVVPSGGKVGAFRMGFAVKSR